MPGDAVANNEKLFPVFTRKLSAAASLESYIMAAGKLASWLSSEKAYYPVARPKVRALAVLSSSPPRAMSTSDADALPAASAGHTPFKKEMRMMIISVYLTHFIPGSRSPRGTFPAPS